MKLKTWQTRHQKETNNILLTITISIPMIAFLIGIAIY